MQLIKCGWPCGCRAGDFFLRYISLTTFDAIRYNGFVPDAQSYAGGRTNDDVDAVFTDFLTYIHIGTTQNRVP